MANRRGQPPPASRYRQVPGGCQSDQIAWCVQVLVSWPTTQCHLLWHQSSG